MVFVSLRCHYVCVINILYYTKLYPIISQLKGLFGASDLTQSPDPASADASDPTGTGLSGGADGSEQFPEKEVGRIDLCHRRCVCTRHMSACNYSYGDVYLHSVYVM